MIAIIIKVIVMVRASLIKIAVNPGLTSWCFCGFFFTVAEQMDADPKFMHFGLWAATVSSVGACLVFSTIGALMAIVNTAATPVDAITGR